MPLKQKNKNLNDGEREEYLIKIYHGLLRMIVSAHSIKILILPRAKSSGFPVGN